MKPKTPKESYTVSIEQVLPNDTNQLGNLLGGQLMHWIDLAAAIAASMSFFMYSYSSLRSSIGISLIDQFSFITAKSFFLSAYSLPQ